MSMLSIADGRTISAIFGVSAVEEQFYLFFAPLALALPRRRLPLLCLSIIFLSVATHLVLFLRGSWHISFDVNSFINFGLLGLGGIAGLYADRRLPSWLVSDPAIVVAFCLFLAAPILMNEPEQYSHWGRISGFAIALLLVQIYQNQQGLVSSCLNSRPLREIGIVSYGAYLIHPVVHLSGLLSFFGIRVSPPLWISMIFELAITLILAAISWRFLKNPSKGQGIRFFNLCPTMPALFGRACGRPIDFIEKAQTHRLKRL